MEAMTQEFMLHRRPHVEIWSAREGSTEDNKIHVRNQTSDGSQTKSTMNISGILFRNRKSLKDPDQQPQKGSISETKVWWISFSLKQNDPPQKQTSDRSQQTKSNVHTKSSEGPNTRHTKTQVFFPGFDYTSYKAIGGKAKSSLQGFSVDESHVAELANHNWKVIASIETGVDIRLASTSITNHCKGQIILRPDMMILQKLSTHTPQVVHTKLNHAPWWVNS